MLQEARSDTTSFNYASPLRITHLLNKNLRMVSGPTRLLSTVACNRVIDLNLNDT